MSPTDYSVAKSVLDGVDDTISTAERTWGVGRLRLLVSDDLRARWDRQWLAWCRACEVNDVAAIQKQGAAVRRAVGALEAEARALGGQPLSPEVWEMRHGDRVIVVCRTSAEAGVVAREGRKAEIWTLDELVRMALADRPALAAVKEIFPGSTVTAIKPRVDWAAGGDELPDGWIG